MHDSTKGIIVYVQDYKENSSLVRVVSQKYGKMTFVARGMKKLTSKNAASCQLFHEALFEFERSMHKDIHILKSTILHDAHVGVSKDLLKTSIASCMCEIADRTLNEGWQYELLHNGLMQLEDTNAPLLLMNVWLSDVLKRLGITPVVDCCVICGQNPHIQGFSIMHGGFVCISCNQTYHVPVYKPKQLSAVRYLIKASLHQVEALIPYECDNEMYLDLLIQFLEFHSSVHLQSYRFLRSMIGIAVS